jgi:hypothetical protein
LPKEKILLNLIWPKVAFKACHIIFLKKSLRSLEEFRNDPCVQIPSKSPCRHSQSLTKL